MPIRILKFNIDTSVFSGSVAVKSRQVVTARPKQHRWTDDRRKSEGTRPVRIADLRHFAQLLCVPTSVESLREITGTLCAELGFDAFILQARVTRFVSGEVEVFASNAAVDWRELCQTFGLSASGDPLLKGLMDKSAPLLWCDAAHSHPGIFALARERGLANGISHVARGRGGAWTLASFVMSKPNADEELLARAAITQLLTCHLHEAVTRISALRFAEAGGKAIPGAMPGALSARERESLSLAASGKTADGIAGVLGISPATAVEHLKEARRKLGAANMPHAVAIAISRGYLSAHTDNPL